MRVWMHRIKRFVLRVPGLRGWLREFLLAPFYLWQLRRLVSLVGHSSRARAETGAKPIVMIIAFRHWAVHRAWETVLTRLLIRAGADVIWLTCDRAVPRCDAMLAGPIPRRLCDHCVHFNGRASAICGVERVCLQAAGSDTAAGEFEPASGEEIELLLPSFQRMLGTGPPCFESLGPEDARIWRDLVRGARQLRPAVERLFDSRTIDAVVGLNGKFFSEAMILGGAARRGIPVWSYERGSLADTVIFNSGPRAIPFATKRIIERLEEPLDSEQTSRIDRYLEERVTTGNGDIRYTPTRSRIRTDTIAVSGRRLYALFTNVVWDSAVAGEDDLFRDMNQWIVETIECCAAQSDVDLVIRVHPAEAKVYWHPTRESVLSMLAGHFPSGLPRGVRVFAPLDAVNSYDLVEAADRVLVYASSIGMEAAVRGRPVIVAANSHYADAPFVYRPRDRVSYLALLCRRSLVCRDRAVELARRYLYRLYFEEMVPVPWVRTNPSGFHVRAESDSVERPMWALAQRIHESARRQQSAVLSGRPRAASVR